MNKTTETKSLDAFQHLRLLKEIAHVTRKENNDLMKMLTFNTTSKNKAKKQAASQFERAMRVTGLRKKMLKERFFINFNRKWHQLLIQRKLNVLL